MSPNELLLILRRIQLGDIDDDFEKFLTADGNFKRGDMDALLQSGLLEHQQLTALMEDVLKQLNNRRAEKRARLAKLHAEKIAVLQQISNTMIPEAAAEGAAKFKSVHSGLLAEYKDMLMQVQDNKIHLSDGRTGVSLKDKRLSEICIEALEKRHTELFALLYPRIYEHIGAYNSPKVVAAFIGESLISTAALGMTRAPSAYALLAKAAPTLVDKMMPTYFISPALLEAIKHTDFDDDIDWVNMKLPFEAGIFILPKGGLVHPDKEEGECNAIVWSRVQKHGHAMSFMPGIPAICHESTAMSVLALHGDSGGWFDTTFNEDLGRSTIKLNNVFYREAGESTPSHIRNPVYDEALTPQDEEYLEKFTALCFGTLLAMDARPDLLTKAAHKKSIPAKLDKPRKEFWEPNIVGRDYQIKREKPSVVRTPGESLGGHHASPRMHWRRGHHRQQAYGPKYSLHKRIWIEPRLVGVLQLEK